MSVQTSSGNYLSRASDLLQTGSQFSVCGWFRRDTDSGVNETGVEFDDSVGFESYAPARVTSLDRMDAYGSGFGNSAAFGPNPLATGVWQYFLMTKSSTPVMVVKELTDGDGAFGDSVTLDTGLVEEPVNRTWIGRSAGGGAIAPWTFAFIKIWTGIVLTDDEALSERYWRAVVRQKDAEWANYQFLSGALGVDSSGNSRTLTETGTPTFTSAEPTAIRGTSPVYVGVAV